MDSQDAQGARAQGAPSLVGREPHAHPPRRHRSTRPLIRPIVHRHTRHTPHPSTTRRPPPPAHTPTRPPTNPWHAHLCAQRAGELAGRRPANQWRRAGREPGCSVAVFGKGGRQAVRSSAGEFAACGGPSGGRRVTACTFLECKPIFCPDSAKSGRSRPDLPESVSIVRIGAESWRTRSNLGEFCRIVANFGQHGQFGPDSAKFGPTLADLDRILLEINQLWPGPGRIRPRVAQHRTTMSRTRPIWAQLRPNCGGIQQTPSQIGPNWNSYARIGPTMAHIWFVLSAFRPKQEPTLARHRPTSARLDFGQTGPDFDQTWPNISPDIGQIWPPSGAERQLSWYAP